MSSPWKWFNYIHDDENLKTLGLRFFAYEDSYRGLL